MNRYALVIVGTSCALGFWACKTDKAATPDAAEVSPNTEAFDEGEDEFVDEVFDGGVRKVKKKKLKEAPPPWRSEMERTAFEMALALPGGAIQVSEDVGPIRRFQERRKKMAFFVEKRGSQSMPQTLSLKDATQWYVNAYEGKDVVGPRDVVFAGRKAVRIDFKTFAHDKDLFVSVFLTFRGGFIYGVGIEGLEAERVSAAAARIAQTSRFLGVEPSVYTTTANSLEDLAVVLPASSAMRVAPGFGGVSLSDRESRMHMLVTRVPKTKAPWAKSVSSFRNAVEEEQFKGFIYRGTDKTRVGLLPGFEVRYRTSSREGDGDVFIVQSLVEAYGYVYLFTASAHNGDEKSVKAFSERTLRGARFRKPF